MDGLVGRLFKEFAITLTTAIAISLFVSLTLTPMMCAHLLKGMKPKTQSHLRGFGKLLFRLQQSYSVTLQAALRHRRWVMAIFLATLGLNAYLYISAPKTFFLIKIQVV